MVGHLRRQMALPANVPRHAELLRKTKVQHKRPPTHHRFNPETNAARETEFNRSTAQTIIPPRSRGP